MKKLLESTYAGQQFAKDKAFSQYVWDVLAAAILIDPSLITEERTCAVDVNANSGHPTGRRWPIPTTGRREAKSPDRHDDRSGTLWNMLTAR
ncbi:MAG: hypothetical protein ACLR7Z_08865 [Bilophila wadsworthia]